ncbi:MAG: hypothetical protein JWQ95_4696, partial [Sphaerisporangium sp.]|nr:hypothetical protein [Sphaerisporangium sp.]
SWWPSRMTRRMEDVSRQTPVEVQMTR